MPKLCAAIMLTLGLPTGFARAFLALYTRMTRYLSFKQWTRSTPISAPNGVVQGCSLSLLCNLHMAIWAWLIIHIDGVDFRAFIDDAYLWTRMPSTECPSLPAELQQPSLTFYFGPNFLMWGLVETPFEPSEQNSRSHPPLTSKCSLGLTPWNQPYMYGLTAPYSWLRTRDLSLFCRGCC